MGKIVERTTFEAYIGRTQEIVSGADENWVEIDAWLRRGTRDRWRPEQWPPRKVKITITVREVDE